MNKLRLLLFCTVIFCLTLQLSVADPFFPKVDNIPEDFIMGMDVSSLLSLEKSGVHYYDLDGKESDMLTILRQHGVNTIRLRVWNDPYDAQGHGYGGGNCDVSHACILGKRATELGMSVIIDFHYSDFWADPSKQQAPKAWEHIRTTRKKQLIYEFTRDAMQTFFENGVRVSMVQLGNETNGAFCGERTWQVIVSLMNSAGKAVREVYPDALLAVHFANPENGDAYMDWAQKLDEYKLDYDVFATSYYPWWHGTLDNLKAVLSAIQSKYGKRVFVAETSYAWTLEDGDFSGNTISESSTAARPYSISVQGQIHAVSDVIAAMVEIGGIGICYWEGGWIPVGTSTYEQNSKIWETFGSGWASSYAAEYDPNDAGVYYGGSACDNQTLFDFHGNALPSLDVFRNVYKGCSVTPEIEAIEALSLSFDLGSSIQLPETVNAVFTDNHKEAVLVKWQEEELCAIDPSVPGDYTVHGTAMGWETLCTVHLVRQNYLVNPSFEDGNNSAWQTENFGNTEQLYIENKEIDSLSGSCHYHFYSSQASSVGFRLFQKCTDLLPGTYDFSIAIMGGDTGDYSAHAYVKCNGETIMDAPLYITKWNEWHTADIPSIEVKSSDVFEFGVEVICSGAGAWGKIDDAILNRVN